VEDKLRKKLLRNARKRSLEGRKPKKKSSYKDKYTQSASEKMFLEQWPICIDSMQALYGKLMPLPDERYEQVADRLQSLRGRTATNETEKALRQLWDFDNRFYGEVRGFSSSDYEWAVYSLCYLCKDEEVIKHLLNIYIPLLGRFIQEEFGKNFRSKVGATFIDDVNHYLLEVQELIEAEVQELIETEDHELFDWHGNRNQLSLERIESFLLLTELPPLPSPNFPPQQVLLHFTNFQWPFDSEAEYLQGLQEFYWDKGYSIRL